MKGDVRKLLLLVAAFGAAYLVPVGHQRVQTALLDAFVMLNDYARKHVLFCLVPAFFIAGAIAVFLGKGSVMRYFGPRANKVLSYGVASVSGTILAVCSCTVLPLFAGIYTQGAGIGPATAFLYSGPAVNILAIILTARVLGFELGLARAVGAVVCAVVVGLLMAFLFRKDESERSSEKQAVFAAADEGKVRPLWQVTIHIGVMVMILIFAAWTRPPEQVGVWWAMYRIHWYVVLPLLVVLALMLWGWFTRRELSEWVGATWGFAAQIMPLLFLGVLAAGFLLGMPGSDHGIIPNDWISKALGGNSLAANAFASVAGAFMYFATLTEVPILQGLLGSGMGKGPALALLLAGPALSLPSMLVINSVIGPKKTLAYVAIVVGLATCCGLVFGAITV